MILLYNDARAVDASTSLSAIGSLQSRVDRVSSHTLALVARLLQLRGDRVGQSLSPLALRGPRDTSVNLGNFARLLTVSLMRFQWHRLRIPSWRLPDGSLAGSSRQPILPCAVKPLGTKDD
jgi:hypothetical protein